MIRLDPANGEIDTVTQVSTGGNLVTSYTYTPLPTAAGQPPAGLVASMKDPRGIETDYQYTAHGLLSKVTYAVGTPDQASVSYSYSASDDLVSSTDELGRVTSYVVDNRGNRSPATG